jgi:cysteine desulfurase
MRIYLDNNATTPIHPAVLPLLQEALQEVFGNASSIHKEGQLARRVVEEARESVAGLIGAEPRDLVFTSGGTESNNAAIYGAVVDWGGVHVVTTSIEHPSVLEAVNDLQHRGVEVTVINCKHDGSVAVADILAALRPQTRLVSIMLANNETGVVQDVAALASICRARGILLHSDAVQAAGKVSIDVETLGVDLLSLSAHKLHGPKGIGALYVRRGVVLAPHLRGGAQERRRRAGTENVPLAAAFGHAARIAREEPAGEGMAALRDRLESGVRSGGWPVTINGAGVARVPNTSSITFHGADAEGIVIGLDLEGIAVSTGSACSSGRVEPSRVLLAMGLSPADARATVRFSLSRFTTRGEIDRVVEVLGRILRRSA